MPDSYLEQLKQIFNGVTKDGDLISKVDRDMLVQYGMVEKAHGFNFITRKGIMALFELGIIKPGKGWNP